jgi:hypothetical protein
VRQVVTIPLVVIAAAVLAGTAAADTWGESDFRAAWPSSGRSVSYRLTVPSTRFAASIAVDGVRLNRAGVRYALRCPTFASRASMATWYVSAYGRGTLTVTVTLSQGLAAWSCLSGYVPGSTSTVAIDTWR